MDWVILPHPCSFQSLFWSGGVLEEALEGADFSAGGFLLDKLVQVLDLKAGQGLWGAGLYMPQGAASSGTLLKCHCWPFTWRNAKTQQQTDEKPQVRILSDCPSCNNHLCANALAQSLPFTLPSPCSARALGWWSL